ncbi:electron transfer flavoprotein subunit alpha/FixB family protein [Sciscionella marina]|uniref:electron transfer flavoprotein subunit alpha/FixB family protein n=1 Tax=Sciscionella marina TaxID=508770 RepID=UPI00035F3336|nr:electron transfer flavoprotein subunit alpha/FixB family protein [Sciscionella marina]
MLLAYVDVEDGTIAADSVETLRFAAAFGAANGIELAALAFGDCAESLGPYGIGTLHVVRHELLAEHSPQLESAALAGLVTELAPEAVFAPGSAHGNELLANTAARLGLPFAANCLEIGTGEPWPLTRSRGGGVLFEDAELAAEVKLCSIAQGAVIATKTVAAQETSVLEYVPELDPELPRARLVERTERGGGISLATAPVVVSGGRGVGSAEGYAALEELAALLGGAVGCSRVATNNGWRPHSDQVGLTGTKIAPELYIACGISGATQHWVGCMHAKHILAINTDPEAPMVTRSTYAVLGDVHEVIPALVAAIRAR